MISPEDAERVGQHNWHWVKPPTVFRGYARTKINADDGVLLQTFIMGIHVNHADGDTLNNRRENFRVSTLTQDSHNRRKRHGTTSRFKGVYRSPTSITNPWQTSIMIDKVQRHLGCFATEELAAAAYNDAAIQHFGEFARLNDLGVEATPPS